MRTDLRATERLKNIQLGVGPRTDVERSTNDASTETRARDPTHAAPAEIVSLSSRLCACVVRVCCFALLLGRGIRLELHTSRARVYSINPTKQFGKLWQCMVTKHATEQNTKESQAARGDELSVCFSSCVMELEVKELETSSTPRLCMVSTQAPSATGLQASEDEKEGGCCDAPSRILPLLLQRARRRRSRE